MRLETFALGIPTLLSAQAFAAEQSYQDSITALAYGNVGLSSNLTGDVWLNMTRFERDKIPYLHEDVGITSLDKTGALEAIARLAESAAKLGNWGDLVFLYNAFSMNAHEDFVKLSSEEMEYGLLIAVAGEDGSVPDGSLVDLYASTSTSRDLAEAFKNLKGMTKEQLLEKRWKNVVCDAAHKAAAYGCEKLIDYIMGNLIWKSGGPRSLCRGGCCISWSVNARFQLDNLYNAAETCMKTCANIKVSCKVHGVRLQKTLVNQCLSNRPNGCS